MAKVELKLEIDEDLLQRATAAKLPLPRLVEAALERGLADKSQERAAAWTAENAEAIRDHEARIARYGVFGEDLRTW